MVPSSNDAEVINVKRISTIAFRKDNNRGDLFVHYSASFLAPPRCPPARTFGSGGRPPGLSSLAGASSCALLLAATAFSQDTTPPALVFNPISVQLDPTGRHTLTPTEIARIAAGSTDPCGITNI